MNETHLAYGQLLVQLSFAQLQRLMYPLPAQLRESSHYADGHYLVIEAKQDARITFEQVAVDEFLLQAEANTQDALMIICQQVSELLYKAQMRHRLELYDAADMLCYYFHYQWPAVDPTASSVQ